ncbi:MAG: helix-turn-helix domain-containing protein, partial [Eubacterium sp.]
HKLRYSSISHREIYYNKNAIIKLWGDILRLRDLREDYDLRQSEIAEYLNIQQNTYSQYETGKRDIPVSMLWKLADYYGTTVDYLIGRTDKK